MIVYAGKQFWNDFNNWDEWVFQDANRPRDNDKFKLQPWLQSWRWDWKKTNKNRMPSMFHTYWFSMITWYDPNSYKQYDGVVWMRIRFKSKYTESDFSSIAPYSDARGNSLTASQLLWYVNDAYGENGDAKANVVWEYLEIQESWVYFIDMFAQFIYPAWYSYASNNSYPLYLWLIIDGGVYAYTQGRSCFYLDRLHETFATPITKGSKLALWVAHGYTSAPILVAWGITAVRMD